MDWVSFDEIKKEVSLQVAIEHYGIRLRRVNAHTFRGKCPLPTHRSEASKESFTATLSKGIGGAWACQSQSCIKARGRVGGNVLDFVAAMEQCTVREAAVKLQTWFLVPVADRSRGLARKEPRTEISVDKEMAGERVSEETDGGGEGIFNKPLSFALQNIDCTHPYLFERGLTRETAEKFGVGFFSGRGSMQNRIVIPIHNVEGDLVAYAGRAIDGSEPRYKFPSGFHKSLEVFNLHRVKGELSVVLVEGFFDCMKITQAGCPCVALMGSSMSDTQEDLLRNRFAEIILMLDGDEAGRKATDEIRDRLECVMYSVRIVQLPEGVQPDQLSDDEIRSLLDGTR